MTKRLIGFAFIIFLAASCKKETENFTTESIKDYFPLQVGKYITYDLDSTVFTNFNRTITVRHYQAQYRVDAETTDNLGRAAFTISRYLRTDSTQPWTIDNVFTAISTGKSIEFIEDNLRFIKLMMPIKKGFSWKGNSYLPTFPYPTMYQSSGTSFTEDWNYIYDSIGIPLTINSNTIENTLKVVEIDDSVSDPVLEPDQYADKTYSVEKYGKGIGLIYREMFLWEYQPPYVVISPGYTGFGVKMSMIDHN
jgi:hypothetical protein